MSSANTVERLIFRLTRLKDTCILQGKIAEANDIDLTIKEVRRKYNYYTPVIYHDTDMLDRPWGMYNRPWELKPAIKVDIPKTNYIETTTPTKVEPAKKDSDFYIHAYVNTKACWDCPICEERLIQHMSLTVSSITTMPLHIESLVQELAKRAKDHLERHATGEIGDRDNNSSSNDEQEVPGEDNGTT